jgi:hypothetical protein
VAASVLVQELSLHAAVATSGSLSSAAGLAVHAIGYPTWLTGRDKARRPIGAR